MIKFKNSAQLIEKLSVAGLALCVVDVSSVLDEPITFWSAVNLVFIAFYLWFFVSKLRES